eukprot:2852095-Rhodomonas_salina.5
MADATRACSTAFADRHPTGKRTERRGAPVGVGVVFPVQVDDQHVAVGGRRQDVPDQDLALLGRVREAHALRENLGADPTRAMSLA